MQKTKSWRLITAGNRKNRGQRGCDRCPGDQTIEALIESKCHEKDYSHRRVCCNARIGLLGHTGQL
jgi:hypothetical protein